MKSLVLRSNISTTTFFQLIELTSILRSQAITDFKPGDEVYLDIHVFDDVWYDKSALPDSHIIT